MMLVSCLNNISRFGLERLTSDYKLTDNVSDSNLILVRSFNMHDMEVPKGLLAVARAGAGVNNIPLDKYAEQGIVVFNTPGANANGVKELVIAGMLLASRDIIGGINWVKENKNDENIVKSVEKAKAAFAGNEILGKTIGVIGLGAVGGKVATAAFDLGMKVIGYDPYLSESASSLLPQGMRLVDDLEYVYKNADFISLHLPLLDSTRHMISGKVFQMMKPGVVVLNFSRDLLVDDDQLEIALKTGIVKKYVTDFPNYKTANLDNVITIPHLGASTEESEDNCAIMAADQLMRYVETGSIINSVNYPSLDPGSKRAAHRAIILHHSKDDFLTELTKILEQEIKIANLLSKTKGQFSATVIDFDDHLDESITMKIGSIEGVIKVRLV